MFYSCQQLEEEVNEDGQTRDQVEKLSLEATLKHGVKSRNINMNFTKSFKHKVSIAAFVKDLDSFDED